MCIAILYRGVLLPDRNRLLNAFLAALTATGSDTNNRKSDLNDRGDAGFDFVIWGKDSLDCHAYHEPVLPSMVSITDQVLGGMTVASLLDGAKSILFVENAPLADLADPIQCRRLALAVADLLDDSAFAIWEYRRSRLALVLHGTATILRSENPADAFAESVHLPRIAGT